MEFTIMGKKISLRGIQPPAAKIIQSGRMDKLLVKPAEICMISVGVLTEGDPSEAASLSSLVAQAQDQEKMVELHSVLQKYNDIFEEPKELPPSREHDNKIVLKRVLLQSTKVPTDIKLFRRMKLKRW